MLREIKFLFLERVLIDPMSSLQLSLYDQSKYKWKNEKSSEFLNNLMTFIEAAV